MLPRVNRYCGVCQFQKKGKVFLHFLHVPLFSLSHPLRTAVFETAWCAYRLVVYLLGSAFHASSCQYYSCQRSWCGMRGHGL